MAASEEFAEHASRIAALAEPVRRSLYLFVSRQPDPVSREQAATALDVPTHTAKFHLDKLVDEGLLEVEFRRRPGRTGPGAGRPAKMYRRSAREITVSLPERHYDLIGQILAEAIETSPTQRIDVATAATLVARREGVAAGKAGASHGSELTRTAIVLENRGYEPRVDDQRLLLENCPFHRLAQTHTELVCGLNLAYVGGVIDGLGCTNLAAVLEPDPTRCCVVAEPN